MHSITFFIQYIYTEEIFKEAASEGIEEGLPINGRNLNIGYTDDMIVFADNVRELQDLVDNITRESSIYGLDINISKTKFMLISKNNIGNIDLNLKINNQIIERVKHRTYLGTIINGNWDISQEIKT